MVQMRKKELPVMVTERRFIEINLLNFHWEINLHDFLKKACHIWIDHTKTYPYMPNLYGKTSFSYQHIWWLTSDQNRSFLRGVTHSAPYGRTLYKTWGILSCGTWHRCVSARFGPRDVRRSMIWPVIYWSNFPQLVKQWVPYLSQHNRCSSFTSFKKFNDIGPLVREIHWVL